MKFELEALVKAAWKGIRIVEQPSGCIIPRRAGRITLQAHDGFFEDQPA